MDRKCWTRPSSPERVSVWVELVLGFQMETMHLIRFSESRSAEQPADPDSDGWRSLGFRSMKPQVGGTNKLGCWRCETIAVRGELGEQGPLGFDHVWTKKSRKAWVVWCSVWRPGPALLHLHRSQFVQRKLSTEKTSGIHCLWGSDSLLLH